MASKEKRIRAAKQDMGPAQPTGGGTTEIFQDTSSGSMQPNHIIHTHLLQAEALTGLHGYTDHINFVSFKWGLRHLPANIYYHLGQKRPIKSTSKLRTGFHRSKTFLFWHSSHNSAYL